MYERLENLHQTRRNLWYIVTLSRRQNVLARILKEFRVVNQRNNQLRPLDYVVYYLILVVCVCIGKFSGDYGHTVNAMAFKFCEKFPLINI